MWDRNCWDCCLLNIFSPVFCWWQYQLTNISLLCSSGFWFHLSWFSRGGVTHPGGPLVVTWWLQTGLPDRQRLPGPQHAPASLHRISVPQREGVPLPQGTGSTQALGMITPGSTPTLPTSFSWFDTVQQPLQPDSAAAHVAASLYQTGAINNTATSSVL